MDRCVSVWKMSKEKNPKTKQTKFKGNILAITSYYHFTVKINKIKNTKFIKTMNE